MCSFYKYTDLVKNGHFKVGFPYLCIMHRWISTQNLVSARSLCRYKQSQKLRVSKEAEFVLQPFCTYQQFKMAKLINKAVKTAISYQQNYF